jgi:hypothetical protein
MINAKENVLDAQHEVTARRRPHSFLGEDERWRIWPQQSRHDAPVLELDAHEHIHHGRRKSMHADFPTLKSVRHADGPALDFRAEQSFRLRHTNGHRVLRQRRMNAQHPARKLRQRRCRTAARHRLGRTWIV